GLRPAMGTGRRTPRGTMSPALWSGLAPPAMPCRPRGCGTGARAGVRLGLADEDVLAGDDREIGVGERSADSVLEAVLQGGADDEGRRDEPCRQGVSEADRQEARPMDPDLRQSDSDHRALNSLRAVTTLSRVGCRTSPVARPSLSRTTRWACEAAIGSWVTMMIVCPYRVVARPSRDSTSAPAWESRLPVGSSAKMTSGLVSRARATATRCC